METGTELEGGPRCSVLDPDIEVLFPDVGWLVTLFTLDTAVESIAGCEIGTVGDEELVVFDVSSLVNEPLRMYDVKLDGDSTTWLAEESEDELYVDTKEPEALDTLT